MSTKHIIKFYPVGNGDNVLVKLNDDTTVIIDCQIRDEIEKNGIKVYDVKRDILKEIARDSNNNPFVDLFISSHPHNDHCQGFEKNYYCGSPSEYSSLNREKGEIIIGELWVTERIFSNDLCESAKAIRSEAKRRRKIFNANFSESQRFGNRLKIIGYNEDDNKTKDLHYVPGNLVSFNPCLSIFVHAPFKKDLVRGKADQDHNATSIVLQMQFFMNHEIKSRLFLAGDADHYVFEQIIEQSKNHYNADKLEWDIFLAPHHCSWSFFNDRPYAENVEPKDYSLEFLDYRKPGAHVIASSRKIEDKEPNPPHYPAKQKFCQEVGETKFKNTAIHINEKAPQPLVYYIDETGFTLSKNTSTAAATILTNPTPRAG